MVHEIGAPLIVLICFVLYDKIKSRHLDVIPMYKNRKVDQFPLDWKNSPNHLPLVIRRPRQVGKTESILHFAKKNYSRSALCYYQKENGRLEEDFFLKAHGHVIPVEVKATNGRAQSLRRLIKSDSYPDISEGIKLIKGNIGFENQIHTFPYFCAFLLPRYLKQRES